MDLLVEGDVGNIRWLSRTGSIGSRAPTATSAHAVRATAPPGRRPARAAGRRSRAEERNATRAGGEKLEHDGPRSGLPTASGTPGSGPNGRPVVRETAQMQRGTGCRRYRTQASAAAGPAEQQRPAELNLAAKDEEEAEAPPLGEVLRRDGEVHQRRQRPRPRRERAEATAHGGRRRIPPPRPRQRTPRLPRTGRSAPPRPRAPTSSRAPPPCDCKKDRLSMRTFADWYRSVRAARRRRADAKMPGMRAPQRASGEMSDIAAAARAGRPRARRHEALPVEAGRRRARRRHRPRHHRPARANGAGKTTFISLVLGLRTRDAGELTVLGHDPAHRASTSGRASGTRPSTTTCRPTCMRPISSATSASSTACRAAPRSSGRTTRSGRSGSARSGSGRSGRCRRASGSA